MERIIQIFNWVIFVCVKSPFTYDVLLGISSYSRTKKSNSAQIKKLIEILNNIKPIKICLVDVEIFNYIEL